MDYYELAEDNLDTARVLIDYNKYMQSVYYSCLAAEMYLKSKHSVIFSLSDLDKTHDVIGLYRDLTSRYSPSKNLSRVMITLRKYFNESRYPSMGVLAYTKEFAEQFVLYVIDTKYYVDNDCQATIEDLKNKFNGSK